MALKRSVLSPPVGLRKNRSPLSKFFWFLVLAFCFSGLGVIVFRTIFGFLATPTATSITVHPQVEMPWPDILLCPKRTLNRTHLARLGLPENVTDYVRSDLMGIRMIQNQKPDSEELERDLELKTQLMELTDGDPRTALYEASPDCSDVFRKCILTTKEFDCCSRIQVKFDLVHGKCFLISGLEPSDYPDIGLIVHMDLRDEPRDLIPASIQQEREGYGASLKIHAVFDPYDTEDIEIDMGQRVKISVEKELIEFHNTAFKEICDVGGRFPTTNACKVNCSNLYAWNLCNCQHLLQMDSNNCSTSLLQSLQEGCLHQLPCSLISLQDCLNQSTRQQLEEHFQCIKDCKPPCLEPRLRWTVSYSNLGSDRNTELEFHVHFRSLQLTHYRQVSTITLESVVGNIGGTMGVFLGASLITIIEWIQYLCLCTWKKAKKVIRLAKEKRRKKNRRKHGVIFADEGELLADWQSKYWTVAKTDES